MKRLNAEQISLGQYPIPDVFDDLVPLLCAEGKDHSIVAKERIMEVRNRRNCKS